MPTRITLSALIALLSALPVLAQPPADADPGRTLVSAWPALDRPVPLQQLGKGVGILFSPDMAMPGNRRFYENLGFAYFQSASWRELLDDIELRNRDEATRISVLVVETHGTNGEGLKVQEGHDAKDRRSYIAVGGLQQALERSGVAVAVISACNAGRLFRPSIYDSLDPSTPDPLFLPASEPMISAPPWFDPATSGVEMVRRKNSNYETLVVGSYSELPARVAALLFHGDAAPEGEFSISTLLMQAMVRDPRLQLASGSFVLLKSKDDLPATEREQIFNQFVELLDEAAGRELTRQESDKALLMSKGPPVP